ARGIDAFFGNTDAAPRRAAAHWRTIRARRTLQAGRETARGLRRLPVVPVSQRAAAEEARIDRPARSSLRQSDFSERTRARCSSSRVRYSTSRSVRIRPLRASSWLNRVLL